METQIPYFSGSTEERLKQIEGWIRDFAEKQAAKQSSIYSIERAGQSSDKDEIIITYSDGSKRRYLLQVSRQR